MVTNIGVYAVDTSRQFTTAVVARTIYQDHELFQADSHLLAPLLRLAQEGTPSLPFRLTLGTVREGRTFLSSA